MKNRNILLIVEGETTEVEVFNKIGALFFDRKTKLIFYPYKSNIYSLYQKIKEYDELTSTIEILKEIAPNKKMRSILNINFSEIFLIFDFDPQEPAYSDRKIIELTSLFDNETEFGKLYINYPMMESLRDHNNFDLINYLSRHVSLENLSSDSYKDYIKKNGYKKNLDKMTIRHFKKLSKLNITKTNYILNNKKEMPDFNDYHRISNQMLILDKQLSQKNSKNEISVLNTCMMFIVDYFGEKYYKDIKKA